MRVPFAENSVSHALGGVSDTEGVLLSEGFSDRKEQVLAINELWIRSTFISMSPVNTRSSPSIAPGQPVRPAQIHPRPDVRKV